MSQSLAAECRLIVGKFLEAQTIAGVLSFSYSLTATSVSEGPSGRVAIRLTFSRPTAVTPAPTAVVHVRFLLNETMDQVAGFLLEEDPHVWPTGDVEFDDRTLQRVLDRKLRVRASQFVDLFDDFASTRVPAAIRVAQDRDRQHDRENMEEQLLEYFQRKDPYNDGRFPLPELVSAIYELDAQALISGRGRPNAVPVFPKEVLLALAPSADRDQLVEYGPLVSMAADALDSWAGWDYYCQQDATADEKDDNAKSSLETKACSAKDEVYDRYRAVYKNQLEYQVGKLRKILEIVAAVNVLPLHDSAGPKTEEPEPFEEAKVSEEPEDNDQEDEGEPTASSASLRVEHVPQLVNLRQLQNALESPSLLLSTTEVNLILALAVGAYWSPESDGEQYFPVADIPDILVRSRFILFSFQRRTFLVADYESAIENYLTRQFESFERDTLKGSATHLAGKLTLKQVKQVTHEELPRLVLSVVQAAHIVAICDGFRQSSDDRVRYRECIVELATYLRFNVALEGGPFGGDAALELIGREDEMRSACVQVLGSLDGKQLGVVTLSAFGEGIRSLLDFLRLSIQDDKAIRVLTAAADATGAGRVNYAAFQHQLLPLIISICDERKF